MPSEDTVPELTVAMPTRNVARFLRQAISSVLIQEGVEFELILVDDASEDESVEAIESFRDPRIRLIRNTTQCGIAHCHNQIVAASRAPFIAHVDSDDVLLPGALATLLETIRANPDAGQAHTPPFIMEEDGSMTREMCRSRFRFWAERRPVPDYRKHMLSEGMVVNCLRTYRKEALEVVGRFNEAIPYVVDWEMGVRILDRFEIVQARYPLYIARTHALRTSLRGRFPSLDHWWRQLQIALHLRRQGDVRYLRRWKWNPIRLMVPRLLNIFRLDRLMPLNLNDVRTLVLPNLLDDAYRLCERAFSWWPAGLGVTGDSAGSSLKVGYYLWRYPSTTFVQREVEALAAAGIDVEVFAEAPGDGTSPGSHLEPVPIHYRLPENREFLERHRREFRRRHPLRYANLFWFTMTRRYSHYKTFREDRSIFDQAISLAGLLREAGISHLHAPWADRSAFVCLLAARLLGIPYSVQARAHELYRDRARFALRDKFKNARFVVTNAHYNEPTIRAELPRWRATPIHVVYEGISTHALPSTRPPPNREAPAKILCVARLIEEKGLVHLLEACRRLRAQGFRFHTTVIGGPEEPTYTRYYIDLIRLHRRLNLEDVVTFAGFQPFEKVRKAYVGADLFVLPCVQARNGGRDITPNSLIEAMAAGLPVISTRSGAIPELVEHGETGLLVPPADDEALTNAVVRLLQDRDFGRKLGTAGRKRMEERFDITKNIQAYRLLFRGEL